MTTVEDVPPCELTDDELGIDHFNFIIPDTWVNISWVLQNSIGKLIERMKIDCRNIA